MKILLTGATGFVGKNLGALLVSQGHTLNVLVRNPDLAKSGFGFACESFEWESGISPVPERAFNGVEAVIHLAGEPITDERWNPQKKQRILDSRVLGTRTLVKAMMSLPEPHPKIFICASATGYYGERAAEILSETSKPGSDFLASVCQAWENEALQFTLPASRVICLRIGIVLGRTGGAMAKLLPLFRSGLGGPLGRGDQWMSWIHLDDLTRLILHCLTHQQVQGPINAVSPEPVTNLKFTKTLARALRKPAFFKVPAFALRMAVGEVADVILSSQRIRPDKAIASGFHFKYASFGAACESLK